MEQVEGGCVVALAVIALVAALGLAADHLAGHPVLGDCLF
jgi:hypothetical protein